MALLTATPLINLREKLQNMRIFAGIRTGKLTPKQAEKLNEEAAKIKQMKASFAEKGRIKPLERMALRRQLRKQNRRIVCFKHFKKG